jgi:putative DNA primase/helicase
VAGVVYGRRLGWSFTPLAGKRPIAAGWQKADRETDEQASAWAAAGNVGVRCGAASADAEGRGLLVIDLDTAKAEYDAAAVRQLHLPHKTPTARTGTGGWHIYLRLPSGVRLGNSAGRLARCVDTRGDGGQVVFPGSTHPDTGQPYRWSAGCAPWEVAVAEVPPHVLAVLQGQKPPVCSPGAKSDSPLPASAGLAQPATRQDRYGRNALAAEMLRVTHAAQGTRNATLNEAGYAMGQLVAGGVLLAADVEAGLLGAALAVGLPRGEAVATIASGLSAGAREPRGLPEPSPRPSSAGRGSPRPSAAAPAAPSGVPGSPVPGSPPAGSAPPPAAAPPPVAAGGADVLCGTGTPAATDNPDSSGAAEDGCPPPDQDCGYDTGLDDADEAAYEVLGRRDPTNGVLILSARRTLPTATAYVREFHTREQDGLTTLAAHAGRLLAWQRNRYEEVEDGAIRHRLHPWMHAAAELKPTREGFEQSPFPANPATVQAALDTIRAAAHVDGARDVPCWLSGAAGLPDAREVLSHASGNLHIPTGSAIAPTPDLFTFNSLDFDYDPAAAQPAGWLAFLAQLWPDDPQAVALLQEWFGYCLTADTRQHKMMLLIGPRRSGKGTVARVQAALVGRENVAGPTTGSLSGPFGLQPLLGKSLAIVSDARFSGPDMQVVVERLLCVSGEDSVTVDRKHTASVTLKLPTRFMFLSNELPRLHDAAQAMSGRFLLLTLTRSYYGREDPDLTARLLLELPGILLWALQGWGRLHARGRFLVPESSRDAETLLADLTSPVAAFLREGCETGPESWVRVEDLYEAWKSWCAADGRKNVPTRQSFGRELATVCPGLKVRRNHGTGRFYVGIGLRCPEIPGASAAGQARQDAPVPHSTAQTMCNEREAGTAQE